MNEFLMRQMSTRHLLTALGCEPLNRRTTVELELLKRCERFVEYEAIVAACVESHDANWGEFPKLLGVCQRFGIHTAKQLEARLRESR